MNYQSNIKPSQGAKLVKSRHVFHQFILEGLKKDIMEDISPFLWATFPVYELGRVRFHEFFTFFT